jgi:hypothetical protein
MDTLKAFAMGEASRGNRVRVFDWDAAARLIVEREATVARAGLAGDWGYTGGTIFRNGKPVIGGDDSDEVDAYTYLASTWATPELEIDGELIDCWRYADETEGWDANTKWPESALAILNESKVKP